MNGFHSSTEIEFDYERMLAFSQANQQRLANAINAFRPRREAVEAEGNWEDAAKYTRATNEVESLRGIAWQPWTSYTTTFSGASLKTKRRHKSTVAPATNVD